MMIIESNERQVARLALIQGRIIVNSRTRMADQIGSFYFLDQNGTRNPYLTIKQDSFISSFSASTAGLNI